MATGRRRRRERTRAASGGVGRANTRLGQGGRSAARRHGDALELLDDGGVLVTVVCTERHDAVLDRMEVELGDTLQPGSTTDRELRRLHRAVVAASAAIVVQIDLPGQRPRGEERRFFRRDPPELQACGQDEQVGSEPMPALVRGHPDLLLSEALRPEAEAQGLDVDPEPCELEFHAGRLVWPFT